MMFPFVCPSSRGVFPNPTIHGVQNSTFFLYVLPPTTLSSPLSSLAFQQEIVKKPLKKNKKKLEKAELTESLLRSYGFNDAHISKLQTLRPRALSLDPQRILLPKFEFLRSIGVSAADLPDIITLNPTIPESSLKGRLIPSYNFLKTLNLSDKDIVKMMKNYWKFFQTDEEKIIGPKVEVLRALGVPDSAITLLLVHYTSVVHLGHARQLLTQTCPSHATSVQFKTCSNKLTSSFDFRYSGWEAILRASKFAIISILFCA